MVAEVNGVSVRGKNRDVAMESVKAMSKNLPGKIVFEIRNDSIKETRKEANLQDVRVVVEATEEQKAQMATMLSIAVAEQRESWLVEALLCLVGYKIIRSRLKLVKGGGVHSRSSSISSTNPFELMGGRGNNVSSSSNPFTFNLHEYWFFLSNLSLRLRPRT